MTTINRYEDEAKILSDDFWTIPSEDEVKFVAAFLAKRDAEMLAPWVEAVKAWRGEFCIEHVNRTHMPSRPCGLCKADRLLSSPAAIAAQAGK